MKSCLHPVSYTHLDVYKRQVAVTAILITAPLGAFLIEATYKKWLGRQTEMCIRDSRKHCGKQHRKQRRYKRG